MEILILGVIYGFVGGFVSAIIAIGLTYLKYK